MRISLRNFDRAAAAATTIAKERTKGFSIVEVIVAMVLLAIAVSSLAALTYSVSQNAMIATANAYRNGVLMQEVNRLEAIPYGSIDAPVISTLPPVTTGPYPHTTVITVTEPAVNLVKAVQIVIRPTDTRFKPDTASFVRTNAQTSRVLCTDCPPR
jgi:prepilin-type N-terminal cleavage/methylation domain-containing protein